MTATSRSHSILQIRVIGLTETVRVVLTRLTDQLGATIGPDITCRRQTRTGPHTGSIRGYLTVHH